MISNSRTELILISIVYIILTILCFNNVYFWDNIQQTSIEAQWFYETNFSQLLAPVATSSSLGSDIVSVGYHPPLMGIVTAVLWKIFGQHLWVSHLFVFFVFVVLLYNTWKLALTLFEPKNADWVVLILLSEATLLTQFAIASPDFILLTAFVVSFRAIMERKSVLLAISLIFLCCTSMRGVFAGSVIFAGYCYHFFHTNKTGIKGFIKNLWPFVPALTLLFTYFTFYLLTRGWFFSNSVYASHYKFNFDIWSIAKSIIVFCVHSVENGRIVVWMLFITILFVALKLKQRIPLNIKLVLIVCTLLYALYFSFVITRMPFSARYFMPQYFLLTILTLAGVVKYFSKNKKTIFIIIILFQALGHLWIYPNRIITFWDCTLSHLPYYELRKQCFNYIDSVGLNYDDISGGFCFYDDRKFVELENGGKVVGRENNNRYFIYSNISPFRDEDIDYFENKDIWTPIKSFKKWPIYIIIYRQNMSETNKDLEMSY